MLGLSRFEREKKATVSSQDAILPRFHVVPWSHSIAVNSPIMRMFDNRVFRKERISLNKNSFLLNNSLLISDKRRYTLRNSEDIPEFENEQR